MATIGAYLPLSLAANCADVPNLSGWDLDDTKVWGLRDEICSAPSCGIGEICHKELPNNQTGAGWEPYITLSYYTQTGQFKHCYDAFQNIIEQCNRNNQPIGEWDYDGEIYWIVNTYAANGGDIQAGFYTKEGEDWYDDNANSDMILTAGTWKGDYQCVGHQMSGCSTGAPGDLGGCSNTYTWSKTKTSTLTVGGGLTLGLDKILDATKVFTGKGGFSFDASYSWAESTSKSATKGCNPNLYCYQVLARPVMGYSIGIAITGTGYFRDLLSFTPFHLDMALSDTDTGEPSLDWKCDGQCDYSIFNPQCLT